MSDETAELGHCVPCEGGTPALEREEITALLPLVARWRVVAGAHGDELFRAIATADFVSAVRLVDRLTPIAEGEGHHPDLELGWGRLAVRLTTHAVGGLTANDFIMARKFNQLFGEADSGVVDEARS